MIIFEVLELVLPSPGGRGGGCGRRPGPATDLLCHVPRQSQRSAESENIMNMGIGIYTNVEEQVGNPFHESENVLPNFWHATFLEFISVLRSVGLLAPTRDRKSNAAQERRMANSAGL